MTREEFDRFVHKVENGIARRPSALRWRVAGLALLGYALLLSGLVVVVALAAGFFAVMWWADGEGKIVAGAVGSIILLGGGVAVLRALLVKVPAPEGVPVLRPEAPQLFAMLDDLRFALHSTPFHHVRLIPSHNAAVVQVPRLGLLGWSSNYLLLGLPLLEGHPAVEIRAILAHEFAHLSRRHGWFSHWIYRLRRSWESMFAQLARPPVRGQVSLRPLLARAVEFFWPRFNAHAFVLSRTHEYEADTIAARLTRPEHLASALTRRVLQDRFLEQKFWPDLWQMANVQPEVPNDVFVRMPRALTEEPPPEQRAVWFTEALAVPTTNADTHPCLADRLRGLGLDQLAGDQNRAPSPPPVAAPAPSAAAVLLEPSLDQFRARVQTLWTKEINEPWRLRHAKAGALARRLSALEEVVPESSLDPDTLWDKAALLLDLKKGDLAEPLLRQLLSLRPHHTQASFHLGRLLLEQRRDEGEIHLEGAMTEDGELVPQACALLLEHYRRSGRPDSLRQIELRLDQHEKDLAASRAERREVTASDRLIPHDLSESVLSGLRTALAAEPELASAELGRKELRHFPNQRLFLLCVRRRRPWYGLGNSDRDRALVSRLTQAVRLPGRVLVFSPAGGYRALAKKLHQVHGALVFPTRAE